MAEFYDELKYDNPIRLFYSGIDEDNLYLNNYESNIINTVNLPTNNNCNKTDPSINPVCDESKNNENKNIFNNAIDLNTLSSYSNETNITNISMNNNFDEINISINHAYTEIKNNENKGSIYLIIEFKLNYQKHI
ncbi:hypothetical protein K502DRAFT_361197 [Neoconidiobolus thromboides FSU 785]|nr:hypothetical protein K502DRAFT_361197 [Neoconidiobolus thromboides FSU 785]